MSPSYRQTPIAIFIVTLLAASLHGQESFQPLYRAEGTVQWEMRINDIRRSTDNHSFNVAEDRDGKWHMQVLSTVTVYPQGSSMISTQRIAFDGTNIYQVIYSDKRLDTTVAGDGKPTTRIVPNTGESLTATITSGALPLDQGTVPRFVWVAFLSARYLKESTNVTKMPFLASSEMPRGEPSIWMCDLDYALTVSGGHALLSKGIYILNRNYIADSSLDYPQLDEPMDEEALSNFNLYIRSAREVTNANRLVRGRYDLAEVSDIDGINIPKAFRFNLDPPLWRKNNANRMMIQVTAIVTNALPRPGASMLMPTLKEGGATSVSDRRFRFKSPKKWLDDVSYEIRDRCWITDTNDVRIKSALKKRPFMPRENL
jgi:hypothetical protein